MLLESMKMTAGEATAMFIKLRDAKKTKDQEHKDNCTKLVAAMEKLEAALIEYLNTSGATSIASAAGTAYKSQQISATVEDKDKFMDFVRGTDQWEALDIKANKTFVKDYMEENEAVPPGVKASVIQTLGVQRK